MSGFSADDLPHSQPITGVRATIKQVPEDFQVRELLGIEPDGVEEHLYLEVEKRGQNTRWVAQQLARSYALSPMDVSWAGMKDRHALTSQWFSLRKPEQPEKTLQLEGVRVLNRAWHSRKLRRGQLSGNAFTITLVEIQGDVEQLIERLAYLKEESVPNYFGAQRFGQNNLSQAEAWILTERKKRASGFKRGLYLSVLRAWMFNQVLARRVSENSWASCLSGEVAELNMPTGPLWGRGRNPSQGAAAVLEAEVLSAFCDWLEPLEHMGLTQDRRLLVMQPQELDWHLQGRRLQLSFTLGKGCYATMLLRELCACADDSMTAQGKETVG